MRYIKQLYYWLFIVWWSAKKMFRVNLSSNVVYRGKEYIVVNGVPHDSWRLVGLENDENGYVRRVECKKVNTISNHIKSFKFNYNFYMLAWYDIWVHNGIRLWMRTCNIW